ncbi:MAG TPA: potassium transporter Kup [Gemmatimonadales bacterium]|nr:potassium transporter Kup [Gemmatimonadales bacterium]
MHGPGSDPDGPRGKALLGLAFAALGVVYGDIGTSPLYALKEAFGPEGYRLAPTTTNVLGVLSLVLWSMNFVVSFKYLVYVLRADNQGEGGILALLALTRPQERKPGSRLALVALGLFGAALLYGDGIITPAISVLGAVEGLAVATLALERWVLPVTLAILVGLFLVQRHGTAKVGAWFGRITLVWFVSIAALGVRGIALEPEVLKAVNPWYAAAFIAQDPLRAFLLLGAVVLVLTGGEALYADMGHFGRRPIRLAWFAVVLPALMLNYFGQGAILLHDPAAARNPFYSLVPGWGLYPMVAVATGAAVVASQALISGAFSLTRQAIQLGYLPRMTVRHTSVTERGQIYMPQVNAALGVACVLLVLGFRSTADLAGAYGVAVTGTMSITAFLFAAVARQNWGWGLPKVITLTALFLTVDLAFFAANLVKIPNGGWFPLAVAAALYVLMTTWKRGRTIVTEIMHDNSLPLGTFLEDVARRLQPRVPGTAVFMTSDPTIAPAVLMHHVKHNKVLHERVILMSIQAVDVPYVPEEERVELAELGYGFYRLVARYGFMETPKIPELLKSLEARGFATKPMQTSFYLGRETLLPTGSSRMARWRKKLFILMARNAQSASTYFNLTPNRVVEMGAQIQF